MRGTVGVALLMLAGCSPDSTPPPTPPPFQAGILLAAEPELLDLKPMTHFNFGTLRDLWVRVMIPDMGQVSTVWLAFTNPNGVIFHESTLRFSNDPGMTTMEMPGMPHPLDVITAKPVPGGWALDSLVPVMGTVFTRNPMPGAWMVQARTEGQTLTSNIDIDFVY